MSATEEEINTEQVNKEQADKEEAGTEHGNKEQLKTEQVNIFISHKHEDEHTAFRIRDVLKSLDDHKFPRMNFFLSEEILGGDDWYRWVKERLVETNLLLLLFTDSTRSWDWCLYEAGLFDRLDDAHARRIICLHSRSTEPPKPLKHLQAFSAEPRRVHMFLEQLFIGTELLGVTTPLARWLENVPEKLEAVAEEISLLIDRVPVETKYFNKYLFIEVQDPESLTGDHIPPDAPVKASEKTLAIFDKQPGEWTWKDIEEKARLNEDQRWLDELARAIHTAAKGDITNPIHAVFHSLGDARTFSPILYRSDRMANGSITFKVLLYEDVSWQLDDVPGPMRSLATSLLMATRFKYELIEKYRDKLANGHNPASLERYCTEIRQVVMQIEGEAASRGLLERFNLVESFKSAERDEVDGMYGTWYEVRERLMGAVGAKDREAIQRALAELAELNARYLELASRRYHEVIVGGFAGS
jgi:hypothetical protein